MIVLSLAILSLAGCGQGAKPAKSDQAAAPASGAASAPSSAASAPAAPVIDPATDTRPDRVKFDEFASRLQLQQEAWVAADSQLIGTVRTDLQKGSQAEARSALIAYANTIQGQLAGLPPAPILSGCFSRAVGLGAARDAAVAALTARRDQAQPVLAISYRPLNLADFGPLAGQTAGAQQQAQQIEGTLATARTAVAGCDAAGAAAPMKTGRRGASHSPRAFGHYGPAADAGVDPPLPPPPNPYQRSTPLTPSERASQAPEQSQPNPPPKKSKGNIFQRLTHPFAP